ncbi:hypothetical protein CIW52_32320 [Mycolicibacterium sp. P9-64]|uniref:hypothetical protein n=1 Tax=Mycolicibacterium sp. P9-64 TaxID=2024612 RepID=UPI0011F06077|nr:hypothetical protein [Mycolicibacterium sp. P9-64]KAA0075719.1 hypothetical protein CIW52_32320 [Mycolicibacterium sp. P9-64]
MTPRKVWLSECAGLWRRTLLIEEDGSRVVGGDVRWLQADAAYVDSRGFGGRLHQRDDVFEWHRMVDLEPPGPFPDAGVMHWDGDVLVETGVHADYVEHWVRDDGAASPRWALTLRSADARDALLIRVGAVFGWASATAVALADVGGTEWEALAPETSGDEVRVNGVRWTVVQSEGDVEL